MAVYSLDDINAMNDFSNLRARFDRVTHVDAQGNENKGMIAGFYADSKIPHVTWKVGDMSESDMRAQIDKDIAQHNLVPSYKDFDDMSNTPAPPAAPQPPAAPVPPQAPVNNTPAAPPAAPPQAPAAPQPPSAAPQAPTGGHP